MKKFKILFFTFLMLFAMNSMAQDELLIRKSPKEITRDAELQCPPGTLFNQVPGYISASFQMQDPRRVADDFTVASAPVSMRFWGMELDYETFNTCQPSEMTFIIRFYERNLTDPAIPGDEVTSYTLSAIPEYFNVFLGGDFQVDVTFPEPVPVTDGWVSISRLNDGDPCYAFWHCEDMGGTGLGNTSVYMYFEEEDQWRWQGAVPYELELSMAFCLCAPRPPVPITNWALVIGFVLIGTLIIIRYRRV